MAATNLDDVVSLSKRRGFIYPSSEIYGGFANTYDFGPYGFALKENIKNLWFKRFIHDREDIYAIESSIIMNPKIWESSGHTAAFGDIMVEDRETRQRYRADHLIEDYFAAKGQDVKVDGKGADELQKIIDEEGLKSPNGNPLTPARKFNQLFETEVGIIAGDKNKAYIRGGIAQGLIVNFKNILDSIHPSLPFGLAQAGKAFRNEITKGQFTFRTLEFDLMEFEYFFDSVKADWNELFEYWKLQMNSFAGLLGINPENLRWRQHEEFELSHYSKRTEDLEYKFPWGFKEMWGLAYRTDFDLRNHQDKSGQKLTYNYPDGTKILPHVIEPTFGLSRLVTIMLMDAFYQDEVEGETRTVLKFKPCIAPVTLAIFPLVNKLNDKGHEVYRMFKNKFACEFDTSGSIGKRYRRQDEIGTPWCLTVDFDSLNDSTVTIRDRDTLKQERIQLDEVEKYVRTRLDE